MRLPIAIATTAATRAAGRARNAIAVRAGVLAAGAVLAVFLVAPVPRACVELLGAPRAGMARFGGLRVGWLQREAESDVPRLQQRLASYGLTATMQARGPFVILEMPGLPEHDTRRTLETLQRPGTVELHRINADGTLEGRALFERPQIRAGGVTSAITGEPKVAFWLWTPRSEQPRLLRAVRVAIIVDREVRWTAVAHSLFTDVIVLDVDGSDLDGPGEALDGGALNGGTLLYAVRVSPTGLAPFEWTARAALAALAGVCVALVTRLMLRHLPPGRSSPGRSHDRPPM
jgi:hypothetical protein